MTLYLNNQRNYAFVLFGNDASRLGILDLIDCVLICHRTLFKRIITCAAVSFNVCVFSSDNRSRITPHVQKDFLFCIVFFALFARGVSSMTTSSVVSVFPCSQYNSSVRPPPHLFLSQLVRLVCRRHACADKFQKRKRFYDKRLSPVNFYVVSMIFPSHRWCLESNRSHDASGRVVVTV